MITAVVVEGFDKKVIVLNTETAVEVSKLLASASSVKAITDDAKFRAADELCSHIRRTEKTIEDNRQALTKPIEAFKKQIIAAADDVVNQLKQARSSIGDMLTAYQRQQERLAEEARRKIEEEKRKAEEAERKRQEELIKAAQQNEFPAAEVLETVKEIPRPITPFVAVKSQSSKQVTRKVVFIAEPEKVPRNYLVPDIVRIRTDLLAGKIIPGCELREETKTEAK